jgi:hypothetical protein
MQHGTIFFLPCGVLIEFWPILNQYLSKFICSSSIKDQHAAVNMYSGPVHTACHTMGIGFAQNIRPKITHYFNVPLFKLLHKITKI